MPIIFPRNIIAFLFISLTCSCVNNKKLTSQLKYFNTIKDTSFLNIQSVEAIIEKGDILYISVYSNDAKTDAIINMANNSQSNSFSISGISTTPAGNTTGYLVAEDGNIVMPQLGVISAAGKTKIQLANTIRDKLLVYTKEPIVNVRFINYKITVIGEVGRPGTYTIPSEKVTILEAIGLAGDLTIFGKRDNVMLIRESDQKRTITKIDLNKKDLFTSPYYYLKQNDVLYVEMNDRKIVNSDRTTERTTSLVFGTISSIAIVITAFAALSR
jgi:polysaccharide biosynthesis/export protein